MPTLEDILARRGVTNADVRDHLSSLTPAQRVHQATHTSPQGQATLWKLAAANAPVRASELVRAEVADLQAVPFMGQNSQPAFRFFQKVFYRQPGGSLAGRNVGSLAPFIGNGYYVVVDGSDGAFIDYTQVPTQAPSGWPPIARNDRGVSTVVYGFMKDYLRRVHDQVFIGHARKPLVGSQGYFVLARAD